MRPHLLRVTAFGAFGGTAEVPFGALSDAGLFLLHGETGAGKTTLLDAIGFALYGRVPGERNKTKRLRSDHAGAGDRTEVMFETTIGQRHLRITRRPQQVRPKLHGPGTTSEPAKILLEEERGGAWHTVSTRAKEADDEIADAMGMSAEQFFQVVLLPQGQFARFLHADADERRALLQKLFRTDRFRTVEDWLAERRRATRDRVQEADQALATLAARIAQVAGVPVPGDEPPEPPEPAGAQSGAPHAAELGMLPGLAPGEDSAAAAPQPTAAWADALTADAESARAEAAQVAAAARRELDDDRAAEARTRELADRQNRRAALLARRDQLQAAGAQRTAVRRELDAAGRAAEIAKVLDDAERTLAGLVRARDAEASARAAAAAGGLPETAAAADFRAAEQNQRQRVGRLEGLREVAGQADAEDRLADGARRRAADRTTAIEVTQRALADLRARQEILIVRRDAARLASARLPLVRAEADRQRSATADAAQLADDCAGVRDLREQRETAREYANDLRETAQRIRQERIDGMIAELAAQLTDDTACPVCGSFDHPEPSEIRARRVTHHEEEQAYAEADAARDAVNKIDSELAIVGARMGDLIGRLMAADIDDTVLREDAALVEALAVTGSIAAVPSTGLPPLPSAVPPAGSLSAGSLPAGSLPAGSLPAETPPPAPRPSAGPLAVSGFGRMPGADTVVRLNELAVTLAAAAETLEAEAVRLDAEAAQLSRYEADLTEMATTVAEQEKRHSALAEQREAALAEAAAADARAAGHRTSLLTHLDGAPDLESALAATAGLAGALAAAATAADATVAAAETAEQAGTEAVQAAAEARFADVSAARAAWRAPDWRAEQQQGIQAEETEAAAVGAQLADPDLDVPLEPPAGLAGARETVRLAAERLDEAVSQDSRARDRSATLARLVPQFAAALAARQPLRERAEEARRLADLAAGLGANTLRMTLSSFVLAARLEEVAEAASQRLLTMTAGRYSLAHTDARRGGGKAGLGLLACDTWTGQERDTSTLSGGETFLASLALALGLADVVTAEAAGVPIEALFVDEGFGSLDEDTLEEVMNVLDGLREGGRMVGIVSHVSELRQRIPAQVHVRKGRAGSTVELVTP
jgi:exonuclease SbcC